MTALITSHGPIGIFDSGIGGLSVLRHIRSLLPHEDLLYFADSGYAPYGDRPETEIVARSLAIGDFLVRQNAKALVVACNTATAAAIKALRERYPTLLLVGVEPGLKPAAALTATKTVGVLATQSTLDSAKFHLLRERIAADTGVTFLSQACIGLADLIEKSELQSKETAALIQRYVLPLIEQNADTLVLGCTHYPFVQPQIEEMAMRASSGRNIAIVDTGDAVARQLVRLLMQLELRNTGEHEGSLHAFTTSGKTALATAFTKLLQLHPHIQEIHHGPQTLEDRNPHRR